MQHQDLFPEKLLRRVLRQYIKELQLSEDAAMRILRSLLKRPPP